MGNAPSQEIVAQALQQLAGTAPVWLDDRLWQTIFSFANPASRFDPADVEATIRPHLGSLGARAVGSTAAARPTLCPLCRLPPPTLPSSPLVRCSVQQRRHAQPAAPAAPGGAAAAALRGARRVGGGRQRRLPGTHHPQRPAGAAQPRPAHGVCGAAGTHCAAVTCRGGCPRSCGRSGSRSGSSRSSSSGP